MKKIYLYLFALFLLSGRFYSQPACFNRICNGNLDSNSVTVTTSGLGDSTIVYCWHTNATDHLMEIWGNGYNGVPSYSGFNFCELNATQPATMYQVVSLTGGSNLKIQFAHRARANPGQVDSVMVSVGPPGGPFTSLGTFGDGVAAWGFHTVNYPVPATGNYRVRFTPVYWAFGNPGVGNFLDAVTVCEQLNGLGITELPEENSSAVYPNPSSTETKIMFNNSNGDIFNLNLFDYQGRLVRKITGIEGDAVKIERNELNEGMYFFRLESGKKTIVGKFAFTN